MLLSSDPTVGFTNIETSYINGIASCSFTRELKMTNVTNYFDMSKSYYILAAYGPIKSGVISFHKFYKPSSSIYSFQNGSTTPTSTSQPIITTKANINSISFKISWIDSDDSTFFTMSLLSHGSIESSSIYMAFGLSNDNQMV